MKVAVIGYGNVGMAVFRELMDIRNISELVLVGRNQEKMEAEIRDYLDSKVLRNGPTPVLSFGGYECTAGADILVYTAGASTMDDDDRDSLLNENIKITKDIFDEVNKYNKDAVVIVVTNPLDVIVTAIRKFSSRPASKVIGTGNMLESARLTAAISETCAISPKSVNALSIGDHGEHSVVARSYCRICGMPAQEYIGTMTDTVPPETVQELEELLRAEPFTIYHGKGNTAYGVAMCAATLVQAIACDTNEILSVSTVLNGEYGAQDIAISVPCVIGKDGRKSVYMIPLTEDEQERLAISIAAVKANCETAQLL